MPGSKDVTIVGLEIHIQMNNTQCEHNLIPIVYGYPNDQMREDSWAGKIALGGCIVSSDNPNYLCNLCYEYTE